MVLHLFQAIERNRTKNDTIDSSDEQAQQLVDEGIAAEVNKQTSAAIGYYDQAISIAPRFGPAHFRKGLVLLESGNAEEALLSFNTAASIKPDSAGCHYNIGNAHMHLGHTDAAQLAYKRALELNPEFIDALMGLAISHEAKLQNSNAEAIYREVLTKSQDHIDARFNLAKLLYANANSADALSELSQLLWLDRNHPEAPLLQAQILRSEGKNDEARRVLETLWNNSHNIDAAFELASICLTDDALEEAGNYYRQILEKDPKNVDAYNDLGNLLLKQKKTLDALNAYNQARTLSPKNPSILNNIATAQGELGKFVEATVTLRQALALEPRNAPALYNLARIQFKQMQLDAAIASYKKSLEIEPNDAVAISDLATAYYVRSDYDKALTYYQRALELAPGNEVSRNNLGTLLTAIGQFDEALSQFRLALINNPEYLVAHSNLIFTQSYLESTSTSKSIEDARQFARLATQRARPFRSWSGTPDQNRHLRIGLVSSDLRHHSVAYFLDGVIREFSGKNYGLEVFAYAGGHIHDDMTSRLKSYCKGWRETQALSDEQLAEQIHLDAIDILIDLSGHTGDNRLPAFAWRPAPVQVTWLGFCATTGMPEIDYYLADAASLPSTLESQFVETIWRMPECYICFSKPDSELPVSPLPALSNGRITFGSFNNLSKMSDQTTCLWSRVLTAIPNSCLLLKSKSLRDDHVRQSIISRYAQQGITSDRLILQGPVSHRSEHLLTYNQIDIGLDPFPYNGVTTTAEALWMGVPVLTLAGNRFLSRQGVTLLTNSGLANWIANDADDYVARAVAFSSDLAALANLRSNLRAQVSNSPLFDSPRFAKNLETSLRMMWKTWCAKHLKSI